METVHRACPCCRSHRTERIHNLGERWVECTSCGLLWQDLKAGFNAHNQVYESSESQRLDELMAKQKKRESYAIEIARKILRNTGSPGKVLDIGCGTGMLLKVLQEYGWIVEGIEPSLGLSQIAIQNVGPEGVIHQATLDQAQGKLLGVPYDLILAIDVLEHLPTVADFPLFISKWLRPGGSVILQTPNARSWRRFLSGKNWEQLASQEHWFLHTPKSLQILLEGNGLMIDSLRTCGGIPGEGFIRKVLRFPFSVALNLLQRGNALWCIARRIP